MLERTLPVCKLGVCPGRFSWCNPGNLAVNSNTKDPYLKALSSSVVCFPPVKSTTPHNPQAVLVFAVRALAVLEPNCSSRGSGLNSDPSTELGRDYQLLLCCECPCAYTPHPQWLSYVVVCIWGMSSQRTLRPAGEKGAQSHIDG